MPSPSVPEHPDIPRKDPDLQTGEVQLLAQFLDYHRATLELKCAGLDDDQLKAKATPPSTLCLLGLIRHLTEVEYWWFAVWLDGQPDKAFYYTTPTIPTGTSTTLTPSRCRTSGRPTTAAWPNPAGSSAPTPTAASWPEVAPVGRGTCAGFSPT